MFQPCYKQLVERDDTFKEPLLPIVLYAPTEKQDKGNAVPSFSKPMHFGDVGGKAVVLEEQQEAQIKRDPRLCNPVMTYLPGATHEVEGCV